MKHGAVGWGHKDLFASSLTRHIDIARTSASYDRIEVTSTTSITVESRAKATRETKVLIKESAATLEPFLLLAAKFARGSTRFTHRGKGRIGGKQALGMLRCST